MAAPTAASRFGTLTPFYVSRHLLPKGLIDTPTKYRAWRKLMLILGILLLVMREAYLKFRASSALHCDIFLQNKSLFDQGRKIVSGSHDTTIKIWDLTSEESSCIATLEGHEDDVTCCSLYECEGGPVRLVTGSRDGTLMVWDLEKYNCLWLLCGHEGAVSCCYLFNNGRHLLSGSLDHSLKVWNLDDQASKDAIHTITGHKGAILCVSVFDRDRQIISGSSDTDLKGWVLAN